MGTSFFVFFLRIDNDEASGGKFFGDVRSVVGDVIGQDGEGGNDAGFFEMTVSCQRRWLSLCEFPIVMF